MKIAEPTMASSAVYYRAVVARRTPDLPVPQGKRIPFHWSTLAVPMRPENQEDFGAILQWHGTLSFATPTRLRITVALDVRDAKRVEARTAKTNELIGVFDIRYASVCQPFEISIAPHLATQAAHQGIRLSQTQGDAPLYVFDGADPDTPDAFAPHLLGVASPDKWNEFEARLCSSASLQPFGWVEGCVLDGLWQMARFAKGQSARQTLIAHLRRFVSPDGELTYEDPRSTPQRNQVYGTEGLLPFAIIAQIEPGNPVLRLAERAIRDRLDTHSAVTDPGGTTTEGAYLAGYPLAAMAQAFKRDDLTALALAQLRTRRDRNVIGDTIFQNVGSDGQRYLPNWARGVAWYLLGFARVLEILKPDSNAADLYDEFRRVALWALSLQRPNGLWSNFLDDPKAAVDTSGSAGIATALAIGAHQGWLPDAARTAARRTATGLESHLTPDGFLGGMAQFNKGGEPLQRSNYRVIAPMAMGLAAQLRAALKTPKE